VGSCQFFCWGSTLGLFYFKSSFREQFWTHYCEVNHVLNVLRWGCLCCWYWCWFALFSCCFLLFSTASFRCVILMEGLLVLLVVCFCFFSFSFPQYICLSCVECGFNQTGDRILDFKNHWHWFRSLNIFSLGFESLQLLGMHQTMLRRSSICFVV